MTANTHVSEQPSVPVLPSRAERVAQLRQIMGHSDARYQPLPRAIRRLVNRHYDRYVVPLIQACWPELPSQPFARKARFLAADLYASAPYTALFCAANRPWLIRIITRLAHALPWSPRLLGWSARIALALLGRFAYARAHRRIILVAAFIAIIDYTFDHAMTQAPEERGRILTGLLDGTVAPQSGPLRLTRALQLAMSHGLSPAEARPFHAAMDQVKAWIAAEVAAMRGDQDACGLAHRMAGVEGTIDGLLFPIHPYAGDAARRWMVDCSLYIQMMDDWIDADLDAASQRSTPVLTGHWTPATLTTLWQQTLQGIEDLARSGHLHRPHYLAFVREAYVLMLHEVMEAMINGVAD